KCGACNRVPRTRTRAASPVASSRIKASTSAEQSMTASVATDRPHVSRSTARSRCRLRSTEFVNRVPNVGGRRRRGILHQPVTHVTLDRLALRTCPLADHFVGLFREVTY